MVFISSKDFTLARRSVVFLGPGQFTVPNKSYEKIVRAILNLLAQKIDLTCLATCKSYDAVKGMNETEE